MSDLQTVHNCVSSGSHAIQHDNFEEANKAFFNAPGFAEQYAGRPNADERAQRIAGAMLKAYPFNEERSNVMDFACGVGQ